MTDAAISPGTADWRSPDGALQIGHCNTCSENHYYPRSVCPFCFSFDVGRTASTGRGSVYSYSFTSRGPSGPYILAYVTLEEGVTMLTNLVDVDPQAVTIDMPVSVDFRPVGDVDAPVFRPA